MDIVVLIITVVISPFVWGWVNFKKFLIWVGLIEAEKEDTIPPPPEF